MGQIAQDAVWSRGGTRFSLRMPGACAYNLAAMKTKMMLIAVILLSAVGCGKREVGGAKLVIISPHTEAIRIEFERAFGAWYAAHTQKAIQVEWLDQGGTSDIVRFLKSEFGRSPSGVGVDVFFGGGTDPFVELAQRGLTQPYRLPDALLSQIPQRLAGVPVYDTEFRWYGAALSGFGIIFNKKLATDLKLPRPQSWEDLTRPEAFNLVASGDPRHSGTAHMMYEIILQAYGWDKGFETIVKLGANVRSFSRGSGDAPKAVSLGEALYGLAIDFYAFSQIAKDGEEHLGFVLPAGATVVNPDAICILKGAPNLEAAKLFLNFVLSEDGQKLWLLKPGAPGGPQQTALSRMAILPPLYERYAGQITVPHNPAKMHTPLAYDSQKGSGRWAALNDLLGAAIIDTHQELAKAWQAVIKGGLKEAAVKALTAPPITEDAFMALAREKWSDAEVRNVQIAEWVKLFLERYGRVREMAGKPAA